MMETVKRTWKQWLGNLVSDLPECSQVINELRIKLESLLAGKHKKAKIKVEKPHIVG